MIVADLTAVGGAWTAGGLHVTCFWQNPGSVGNSGIANSRGATKMLTPSGQERGPTRDAPPASESGSALGKIEDLGNPNWDVVSPVVCAWGPPASPVVRTERRRSAHSLNRLCQIERLDGHLRMRKK